MYDKHNPGVLHRYTAKLVAFEHLPPSRSSPKETKNILLWIGGLGDGLLSVEYPSVIASKIHPDWTLAEVLTSSSYDQWRTGNLLRDANEVAECVRYFRDLGKEKIVLMGHSTGCQDIMEYLTGKDSGERLSTAGPIDGIILQGSVSDREAAAIGENGDFSPVEIKKINNIVAQAKEMIDQGKEMDYVSRDNHPLVQPGEAAVTAYRTFSLLSKGGDDDYFSSDLDAAALQATFGRLGKVTPAVMFLLGGQDQYVPKSVDRENLLTRWSDFIEQNGGSVDRVNGGVVPGASHNLNGDAEAVVDDLVNRVVEFLKNVKNGTMAGGEPGSLLAGSFWGRVSFLAPSRFLGGLFGAWNPFPYLTEARKPCMDQEGPGRQLSVSKIAECSAKENNPMLVAGSAPTTNYFRRERGLQRTHESYGPKEIARVMEEVLKPAKERNYYSVLGHVANDFEDVKDGVQGQEVECGAQKMEDNKDLSTNCSGDAQDGVQEVPKKKKAHRGRRGGAKKNKFTTSTLTTSTLEILVEHMDRRSRR